MKFDLRGKVGRGLAAQIARRIGKEDFLQQLEETWSIVLSQRTGVIDIDVEVEMMQERIKESGYGNVFKSAGITKDDLVSTLRKVVSQMDKSEKK